MSDANDQVDSKDEPGLQGADASVGYAGEPSGTQDTRDLSAQEDEGPSAEDLDAREEKFTGPRKAMGPAGLDDDPPETTPEEES
jgi:hypothetical protein